MTKTVALLPELVERVARGTAAEVMAAIRWKNIDRCSDDESQDEFEALILVPMLTAAIEATQTDQRGDTTQWADDMAAQMRSYYEAHKRDRWVDGTADNLMLGLLNIALRPDQQLREEVERLREALEPFARAADVKLCGEWADDKHFGQTDVGFYLTFGDLRKARSSLSSSSLTNG